VTTLDYVNAVLIVGLIALIAFKLYRRGYRLPSFNLPSFSLPVAVEAEMPEDAPAGKWLTDAEFVAGMREAFELAKTSTVSFNHNRIMFVGRDTGTVTTLKLSRGWRDESKGFTPLATRRMMPQVQQTSPEGY